MNLSPKFSDLQEIKHGLQHFNALNFHNYNKTSIWYNKNKHGVIFRPLFYQTTLMLLINTPFHQLIQNVKHNTQVCKARIKLKTHYSYNKINTLLKTPIHLKIQHFNHKVQYK
jgi:hypothetical protein